MSLKKQDSTQKNSIQSNGQVVNQDEVDTKFNSARKRAEPEKLDEAIGGVSVTHFKVKALHVSDEPDQNKEITASDFKGPSDEAKDPSPSGHRFNISQIVPKESELQPNLLTQELSASQDNRDPLANVEQNSSQNNLMKNIQDYEDISKMIIHSSVSEIDQVKPNEMVYQQVKQTHYQPHFAQNAQQNYQDANNFGSQARKKVVRQNQLSTTSGGNSQSSRRSTGGAVHEVVVQERNVMSAQTLIKQGAHPNYRYPKDANVPGPLIYQAGLVDSATNIFNHPQARAKQVFSVQRPRTQQQPPNRSTKSAAGKRQQQSKNGLDQYYKTDESHQSFALQNYHVLTQRLGLKSQNHFMRQKVRNDVENSQNAYYSEKSRQHVTSHQFIKNQTLLDYARSNPIKPVDSGVNHGSKERYTRPKKFGSPFSDKKSMKEVSHSVLNEKTGLYTTNLNTFDVLELLMND